MKKLIVFGCAACLAAAGAIQTVSEKVPATSTQAILSYRPANPSTICSVEVYDSTVMKGGPVNVVAASNTSPIEITTSYDPYLFTGDKVYLHDVQGNTAANGYWTISRTGDRTFTLDGSAGNGAYVSGGSVAGLVHDVNPRLFPGADLDSRPGTVNDGGWRRFVVGHRSSEKAADGKYYSRALQVNTLHYYRLVCGPDTAAGAFATGNLPLGNAYFDPIPPDRWPTIDWQPPAVGDTSKGVNAQTIIDPQTGVLLRRLTGHNYRLGSWAPGLTNTNKAMGAAEGVSWTTPENVIANDGSVAAFTGSGSGPQPWLTARMAHWTPYTGDYYSKTTSGDQLNFVQVVLKGSGTAANAADRSVDLCLTLDGVNCFTRTVTQDLGACGTSCTVGDQAPVMHFWEDPADPLKARIPRTDFFGRTGTAAYSAATRTLSLNFGGFFNLNWTNGSKITVGGTVYTIQEVVNPKKLILAAGPAADQPDVSYTASNFGIKIRKTTASADTVRVDYAAFTVGLGGGVSFYDAPFDICAYGNSPQDFSGRVRNGYHCFLPNGFVWFDPVYGDTTYLGDLMIGGGSSKGKTWQSQVCSTATPALDYIGGNKFYCTVDLDGGGKGLLEVAYDAGAKKNLDIPYEAIYRNNFSYTLVDQDGKTLDQLLADTAALDPTGPNWWTGSCGVRTAVAGTDRTYLGLYCARGGKDFAGYLTIMDTATGAFVARAASHGRWPLRGCTIHGHPVQWNDSKLWSTATLKSFAFDLPDETAQCGGGELRTELAAAVPVPPAGDVACPANPFGWQHSGHCTEITVTGDLYDPNPCAQESGARGDAGAYGTWTSAQPGDLFFVTPASGGTPAASEWFLLLAKNGNSWTVARGSAGSTESSLGTPLAHNTGDVLHIRCTVHGAGIQWSALEDPFLTQGTAYFFSTSGNPHGALANRKALWEAGDNYQYYHGTIPEIYGAMAAGQATPIAANPAFSGRRSWRGNDSYTSQNQRSDGLDWFTEWMPVWGALPANTLAAVGTRERLWKIPRRSGFVNCADGIHVSLVSGDPFGQDMVGKSIVINGQSYNVVYVGDDRRSISLGSSAGVLTNAAYSMPAPLNRKHLPTHAFCGEHALADISGPASSISESDTDLYKYCVALADGECYSGSKTGDTFLNCPLTRTSCQFHMDAGNKSSEPCIADYGTRNNALVQIGTWPEAAKPDREGRHGRVISHMLTRDGLQLGAASGIETPDAKWVFAGVPWTDGVVDTVMAAKMPPLPAEDTVERWKFVPVEIAFPSLAPGVDGIAVEFGYDPNFYCTSRRESCFATKAAVDENAPFYWASESFSAGSCGARCEITIPALPQRVLYYRLKFQKGASWENGPTQVRAVP